MILGYWLLFRDVGGAVPYGCKHIYRSSANTSTNPNLQHITVISKAVVYTAIAGIDLKICLWYNLFRDTILYGLHIE